MLALLYPFSIEFTYTARRSSHCSSLVAPLVARRYKAEHISVSLPFHYSTITVHVPTCCYNRSAGPLALLK